LVDSQSSAVAVVGWDPDCREAIFVYKTNGKTATTAYKYDLVDANEMMDALLGDKSLGLFANSLKNPNSQAAQDFAVFGDTAMIQNNVASGNAPIQEDMLFSFGSTPIGNLIPLKRLRDEVAAGNPDPWTFVVGAPKKPRAKILHLDHLPGDISYSW